MKSSHPAESYPAGKGERHRISAVASTLWADKKERCLRCVHFGALQFVDGVAAAGVDYLAIVEHGRSVAGARVAHVAGRAPFASRWVIEFGAGQGRDRQ